MMDSDFARFENPANLHSIMSITGKYFGDDMRWHQALTARKSVVLENATELIQAAATYHQARKSGNPTGASAAEALREIRDKKTGGTTLDGGSEDLTNKLVTLQNTQVTKLQESGAMHAWMEVRSEIMMWVEIPSEIIGGVADILRTTTHVVPSVYDTVIGPLRKADRGDGLLRMRAENIQVMSKRMAAHYEKTYQNVWQRTKRRLEDIGKRVPSFCESMARDVFHIPQKYIDKAKEGIKTAEEWNNFMYKAGLTNVKAQLAKAIGLTDGSDVDERNFDNIYEYYMGMSIDELTAYRTQVVEEDVRADKYKPDFEGKRADRDADEITQPQVPTQSHNKYGATNNNPNNISIIHNASGDIVSTHRGDLLSLQTFYQP